MILKEGIHLKGSLKKAHLFSQQSTSEPHITHISLTLAQALQDFRGLRCQEDVWAEDWAIPIPLNFPEAAHAAPGKQAAWQHVKAFQWDQHHNELSAMKGHFWTPDAEIIG